MAYLEVIEGLRVAVAVEGNSCVTAGDHNISATSLAKEHHGCDERKGTHSLFTKQSSAHS